MPWIAIPLFILLACQSPSSGFDGVSLRPISLCIPLAALLSHRYGRRGLVASLIGMLIASYGVNVVWPWVNYSADFENYLYTFLYPRRPLWPFVPLSLTTPAGGIVPGLAVFALALALAACVAETSTNGTFTDRWRNQRLPGTLAVVLPIMLLPIAVTLYREEWGGGFQIFSVWDMLLLLDAYALWLGLSGARAALVLGTLGAVCAFGLTLEVAGVADDLSRSFARRSDISTVVLFDRVRYGQRAPSDFFLSTACFVVGRALRRLSPGERAADRQGGAGLLFAMLLLLWGGALAYELLPFGSALPPIVRQLQLLGGEPAVPLAALYAGAVFRLRGVAVTVGFALLLLVAKLTLLHVHWTNHLPMPLEQPFVALAFGALGVALRDRLSGSRTAWHALHWIAYLAVLMLMVPQWFEIEDPGQLVWPATTVTALMAAACALTWFWQRRFGPSSDSAPAGWLAFATLAGLVSSLGPQLWEAGSSLLAAGSASQFVTELNRDDELSDTTAQLLLVPAYLAVLFLVATTFFSALAKMSDDVHGIVRWVRGLSDGSAPALAATTTGEQAATRWSRSAKHCAQVCRWAGRIALGFTACALALFIRHSTL